MCRNEANERGNIDAPIRAYGGGFLLGICSRRYDLEQRLSFVSRFRSVDSGVRRLLIVAL